MSGYLLILFICIILNTAINYAFLALTNDYYLATILTSIVIAFIYAIWSCPRPKSQFYKNRSFWMYFFGIGILFLLVDAIMFLL